MPRTCPQRAQGWDHYSRSRLSLCPRKMAWSQSRSKRLPSWSPGSWVGLVKVDVAEVPERHGEVFRIRQVSELGTLGREPSPFGRAAFADEVKVHGRGPGGDHRCVYDGGDGGSTGKLSGVGVLEKEHVYALANRPAPEGSFGIDHLQQLPHLGDVPAHRCADGSSDRIWQRVRLRPRNVRMRGA